MSENSPYKVKLEEGKTYYWCTCGLSQNQPFCDGRHKQAQTDKKSLPFQEFAQKEVWLCGCKQTKTPPFCDGSHQDQNVREKEEDAS
jgi:CDGSH-type Zn-finger protein